MSYEIYNMDCRTAMSLCMAPDSVDSVVCDPPYGLSREPDVAEVLTHWLAGDDYTHTGNGFMGRSWDSFVPGPSVWREAYRVLKPGGHLLAFFGTRTYDLGVIAIRLAGFEIRDEIAWLYGSGFPKSLDISKAIDKAAGARGHDGHGFNAAGGDLPSNGKSVFRSDHPEYVKPTGVTDTAREWDGWGTAAKPAHEPVVFARKPLPDETERAITLASLNELGARLWLLASASLAVDASTLSLVVPPEAFATAQWTAENVINISVDLRGQMGTSRYDSAMTMCSNTVWSWLDTLVALSKRTNTSTTETTTVPTIDWKTLSYCLSATTPACIITALTSRAGGNANVSTAARYLVAELSRLTATLELSAVAPAIERNRIDSQGVGADVDYEPIVVARKPLIGTVAQNVQTHRTGGINIDGCRVGYASEADEAETKGKNAHGQFDSGPMTNAVYGKYDKDRTDYDPPGRFPANVIHDGSDIVLAGFPDTTSGDLRPYQRIEGGNRHPAGNTSESVTFERRGDSGSAARFFYCAKASKTDRSEGCEAIGASKAGSLNMRADAHSERNGETTEPRANNHPTVKPTDLMRYLCRLVTPPGGTILDPFTGSGSTGKAALLEGFNFIGCELDESYVAIAEARCRHATLAYRTANADRPGTT